MKKYIREGLGEEIEKFLEWFLSQEKYDNVSLTNGRISACRLENDIVVLELKVKLGNK